MEASGGYERDWAKAQREAGIEDGSSTPAGAQLRAIGREARQNDAIDAETDRRSAETFTDAPYPRRGA